MLSILKKQYLFARNKLRRQIQFAPKLKDFTQTQISNLQISQLRQKYNQKFPNQLSQILKSQKNLPIQKFYINRVKLQKDIKKSYNQAVTVEGIQGVDPDSLDFLSVSKSSYYDQSKQIQYEKQFNKKLFQTKQIKRLITEKKFNPKNYIQGKQDKQYLQYQITKQQLKNNQISNMMESQNNKQQLQLLIDSGIIDKPQKFRNFIENMKNIQNNTQLINGQISNSIINVSQRQQENNFSQITIQKSKDKLSQYIKNFNSMNIIDKQKCYKNLSLLQKIKNYQMKVFKQRYNAINFRYKGKVQFSHFTQNQILSYIKNQQIQPKDLLLIYDQCQGKLNKINYPIITPAVMSRIYTKSSLYIFPQTIVNSRLNMLNDRLFIQLQKNLFKNLHQLDNSYFTDAIWAYSQNHEQQQGILKPQMAKKIELAIFQQLQFRIGSLDEGDLGLILRAISKMPLINNQQYNWNHIIQVINDRLPTFEQPYQIESSLQFLSLLPPSQQTLKIISNKYLLLKNYEWKHIETLTSILKISALLLRFDIIYNQGIQKWKIMIQSLMKVKEKQIENIFPKLSINSVPYFLTVYYQTQLKMTKLLNMCKKYTIQNIKTQKQILNKNTLPTLTLSMALVDYQQKRASKLIDINSILINNLFSGKVFEFNSIQYFPYHQLGRLTQNQITNMASSMVCNVILGCSLVGYKNQKFYDILIFESLKKIDQQEKNYKKIQQYIIILRCFSLQKRITNLYFDIIEKIQNQFKSNLKDIFNNLSPNDLLSMIISIISLQGSTLKDSQKILFRNIAQNYILLYIKYLSNLEILGFYYISTFLQDQNLSNYIFKYIKSNITLQNIQQRFLIAIINQIKDNKDNQQQQFYKIQCQYQENIMANILKSEQHIGTFIPYTLAMEKIKKKLIAQKNIVTIKPWRLEIANRRQHFMAKYLEDKTSLLLFGLWKCYEEIYKRKGWKMQIICSFLQQK